MRFGGMACVIPLSFLCNENLRMVRRIRKALAVHKENPILLSKVRLPGSTEKRRMGNG